MILILFIGLYFIAVATLQKSVQIQKNLLILVCIILTWMIGNRDLAWADTFVYVMAFNQAPTIFQIHADTIPFGYSEIGYFYLASIIKTIYNDAFFYLVVMGAISMFLLYKSLTKYCIFPLIGICDYIGRFLLNRDFTQMRSSLAILLIIFTIDFIYKKEIWKFLGVVFLAYQFHRMAIIALPVYFLYKVRFHKTTIVISLITAFILSQVIASSISGTVDSWSEDLQYETYTQGNYVEEALGLRNPLIYFQLAVLLVFTFMEEKLKQIAPYYYLLRTGYFYSTMILIFFCNYTALSGRTSTMFATMEMFILPVIGMAFKKNVRILYYMVLGVILIYFFYSKYNGAMIEMAGSNLS